jgi:hypothetical protein
MKPRKRYSENSIYYRIKTSKGLLHRENGPAAIHADGSRGWYRYGQLHRLGGPAVETGGGYKAWFIKGLRHRDDGPAVISSYKKEWWINGKQHRVDGPAIEFSNGIIYWCINGKIFKDKEEWLEALTPEQQQAMLFSEYFVN